MKLSTKCRYGSRAIVEIARNYNVRPTRRREIEKCEGISKAYLKNILITLRDAGIIKTVRGAHGGFLLAKSPEQITMLDIIQALDGPVMLVECLNTSEACSRSDTCTTRDLWQELQDSQKRILQGTTIKALLDRKVEKATANFNI